MNDPLDLDIGHNTKKRLLESIQSIERLESEKESTQENIKDIYSTLKSEGFDTKTLKKIVKRRKKEKEELEMEDTLLETYEDAINTVEDLLK